MDYRIKQLLKVMRELKQEVDRMPKPKFDEQALEKGLEQSANTCRQQSHVFATPLMKNLLVVMGDVKQTEENGEWHTEKLPVGQKSKAVAWMNDVVDRVRLKYNGPRVDSYDHNLPIDDPKLYDTDCWLGWKEEIWDIAPGQADQRKETFQKYGTAKTNFGYHEMVSLLTRDPVLQKAVLIELEAMPEVRAAREVTGISDPFMSKGTGVSYPDYRNDRSTYKGKMTYGAYEIELARRAWKRGLKTFLSFGYEWNVFTAYPRNQRGKGRALEAQSRRTNLVVNMVNGVEMETVKKNMPFIGTAFQNEDGIKASLVKITEHAKAAGYITQNKDYTQWDLTVGEGWLILINAMRYMRVNGNTAKEIIKLRCACNCKSYLVDGPNGKVHPIYGRMMSGYLDTTLGNTWINRVLSRYANMITDPLYTEKVTYPSHLEDIICVGDDYLGIMKPGSDKQFVAATKRVGYNAHADMKDAFGTMFIQYRLIKKDGEWIMAYNWPRVLRSMLSKEDQKGLGKGGWTLSFWQQLSKLRQYPLMMGIALNIAAALDKDHLMLDVPVPEIQRMIQEEDAQKLKDLGTERKSKAARMRTTAERLNSQPQFGEQFNEDGSINFGFFEKLQQELKAVYNPNFLTEMGFEQPDLTKVK